MNRFLLPALLACIYPFLSQAQDQDLGLCSQVVASSGKSAVRAGRYYAYTVGEPFILTLHGGATAVTQGFHQPEFCVMVATNDLDLADWQIEVFPNPTTDFLNIQYSAAQNGKLEAAVFDVLGHLIVNTTSLDRADGSQIDCSTWQAGMYFLQLRDPATLAVATVRFIRL